MGVYEEQIVPIKISRLAEYVSQRKRIALEDALVYIYSNLMYNRLYDEGAKWWYLSTEALYDEFESARKAERGPSVAIHGVCLTPLVLQCLCL